MEWEIKEVINSQQIRLFLDLPQKIYQKDPHWIRPLDKDIEAVFDAEKNKFFESGICKRWLLYDEQKKIVARVATFVSQKYEQEQPTGGMGFFECIEEEKAAHFLLDHCQKWLKEQGMEAMDGPINFGERDRFWGLMTEGFSKPLYCMNYNPPYYQQFFESYGFQPYFYQECFGMKVSTDGLSEKLFERHQGLLENKALQARHIVKKDWRKYAKDFAYIYNKAWAAHGEGKSLDEQVAVQTFKSMRSAMDERINWFVYENEEPVAFWINLPDLNFYFQFLNGKFGPLQKLKFLWIKMTKPNKRFVGIVFGVIPKWQKKGVDAYMILEGGNYILAHSSYEDYEMQWIGDFNPKMINVAKSLGATVTRRLTTYRYLFDREKPFKRHPIL